MGAGFCIEMSVAKTLARKHLDESSRQLAPCECPRQQLRPIVASADLIFHEWSMDHSTSKGSDLCLKSKLLMI
ncbi:MAG: hypothetical protein AB7V13_10175, partial [Pseudorhodoplanes sp.]